MSRATLRASLVLAGMVALASLLAVGAALQRTDASPKLACSACRS